MTKARQSPDEIAIPVTIEAPLDSSSESFWPAEEVSTDTEGSVVSVSLADVELVDGAMPPSAMIAMAAFENALEQIESLVEQGRYSEARAQVTAQLALRPGNPLLLDRMVEIDENEAAARAKSPPSSPALYGFVPRPDGQRGLVTKARAPRAASIP